MEGPENDLPAICKPPPGRVRCVLKNSYHDARPCTFMVFSLLGLPAEKAKAFVHSTGAFAVQQFCRRHQHFIGKDLSIWHVWRT